MRLLAASALLSLACLGCTDSFGVPRRRVEPQYDDRTGRLQLIKYDSDDDAQIDTWSYMDGARVVRIEIEKTAPLADVEWRFIYPSLTVDPNSSTTFYLAADRGHEKPQHKLLVFTRAADGSVGCEVRPFASTDREEIRNFAENLDRRFLPRPQRALPAIATGNRHPEISLPAAFEGFWAD